MQQGYAIEVKNVVKKFKIFYDRGSQLKERALFRSRNRYEERTVLNGISFQVKKGEAIGLIGNNGCGKSTTLKMLTRIMYPNEGTIEMSGRVSSLIELGAGFHPDMTGRENIYINAAIFGLAKKEIDSRVDSIIQFSELGDYIDNPVRTYSSGMYMRLAFSVAISVDAEILLIDEILGVGDAAFQAKCFNRLREIKAAGTTIVIVSHSLGQIEQICDRAIWIKEGLIEKEGAPRDVIPHYMSWIMGKDDATLSGSPVQDETPQPEAEVQETSEEEKDQYTYTLEEILELRDSGQTTKVGNGEVKITAYEMMEAATMKPKKRYAIGDDILFRIHYERMNPELTESMCSFNMYRIDGLNCYSTNCFINTGKNVQLKDKGVVEVLMKNNPLMQGEYKIDILFNKDYGPTYAGFLNAYNFEVYNVTTDFGVVRPNLIWNLDAADSES